MLLLPTFFTNNYFLATRDSVSLTLTNTPPHFLVRSSRARSRAWTTATTKFTSASALHFTRVTLITLNWKFSMSKLEVSSDRPWEASTIAAKRLKPSLEPEESADAEIPIRSLSLRIVRFRAFTFHARCVSFPPPLKLDHTRRWRSVPSASIPIEANTNRDV